MSDNTASWSFETRQLHAGQATDSTTAARALPIYQTTSFAFKDTEHAENLFALKEFGNNYIRIINPTQDADEKRIASLEGGVAALMVGSGRAATILSVLNIAEAGDHIVASPTHGGTYRLFNAESASNPASSVFIEGVAGVAHEAGVPLIVDNTVDTPYLIRPLEWGADVVVHLATKYLGGHGTTSRGVIVDGGTFDLAQNPAGFPQAESVAYASLASSQWKRWPTSTLRLVPGQASAFEVQGGVEAGRGSPRA